MNPNPDKLNEFLGRMVGEMGAAMNMSLVVVGDQLGLYKAMASQGPLSSAEVAQRTGTSERYVREWLAAQAAGGFVEYDPRTQKFTLPDEQAFVLAADDSPASMAGAFSLIASVAKDIEKVARVFRTGEGLGWHEHHPWLFAGTDRFFRPGYRSNLVSNWLPALEGVVEKLERGARVADVGCGYGSSTMVMAAAFPNSQFFGFDYHDASIEAARVQAEKAGLGDRVTFDVASAKAFPGEGYDFVAVFDCLHDMGDPVGAAAHIRRTLKPDGTWMIVEPYANDKLEENLNPVGRLYYTASTMICTPGSKAQEVGLALGAQAGETRLREVVTQGGFTRFRRATETPFNLILEARP